MARTSIDAVARKQFAGFLARYSPEIRRCATKTLARMRAYLPGAVELVYDNYNALVVGFGPNERAAEAVFSLALYPRWVTLFFLNGAELKDPQKLLKGSGKIVRHIVLRSAEDLDLTAIRALMDQALGDTEFEKMPGRMVIRSISAKQRPRTPASPRANQR